MSEDCLNLNLWTRGLRDGKKRPVMVWLHGGGFVFDCRALPNPHEVPELKDLTGEAEPVADFLERSPEVQEYWGNVSDLVDAQVERYVGRGFTSLTVSFGCTGGRHRSVYLAAKLAAHLKGRWPQVGVRLAHTKL